MFYVYDAEGNEFKMQHAVDQRSALMTGKYFRRPPGVPEPPEPAKIPEGEMVDGIEVKADEKPVPGPVVKSEVQQEDKEFVKPKKIRRQ